MHKKHYIKYLLYLVLTAIAGFCFFVLYKTISPTKDQTPGSKSLTMPFSSQAPQENWQEPWLNACEETSIVITDNFYNGNKITPTQAENQILKILAVKEKSFGVSKDESMERIAEIVNLAELSWQGTVSLNPLLNDIKKEIAENRPVIAPVDVRLLLNSPYKGTDIDYHVVVISGYDDKKQEFIVQDPGIQGGKNNRYGYQNFFEAVNDYSPTEQPSGRKAVLFTSLR